MRHLRAPRSSFSARLLIPLAALLLAISGPGDLHAQEATASPRAESEEDTRNAQPEEGAATRSVELPERFVSWLLDVDMIITRAEREAFLELKNDYQRDAFIERFWRVRDPYAKTARNEYRERWEERLSRAKARYETLRDDRARVLLVHGEPIHRLEVRCTTTFTPLEAWYYGGSEAVDISFTLVFVKRQTGPARLWMPRHSSLEPEVARARGCLNGDRMGEILAALRHAGTNYDLTLARVLAKPRPRSEEWIANFAAYSTDLPPDAATLPATLDIDYLGRYQHRTVIQGLLRVPLDAAEELEIAGHRSYDFQLIGEVLLDGQLFENFRYKFGFPTVDFEHGVIPLAFQRYLRPGEYTLILKLQDLNAGDRYFRHERALDVPAMEEVVETPPAVDPESAALFAEAIEAVGTGETSLKILPPAGDLHTGFVRIDTLASGREIDKVIFSLDGRELLTKNRPPYNVEIDLGPFPRVHTLLAEARDGGGRLVAEDQILLNSGGNRFRVRLLEPRKGKAYERSLRARAEVEVPDDRTLERLEFYLNESLVATLYQPPFVQPMALPSDETVAFVRAVAYLPDGNSTEDLVFINAPEYLEEVDVQLVELYTTVLDQAGRPVQDLTRADFSVFEDGKEQKILRFEEVEDTPFHVAVLLDNSGSMRDSLYRARLAALSFFQNAILPQDRAAIITFNSRPTLAVKFTSDLAELGGGLAGLTAEGETALYDSVMFGLYYLTGIKGQRTLLLLSDGKDESSRFNFEETLEYARRAGVTIYAVGLDLRDYPARGKLTRLADETGGRSFFIQDIADLATIYTAIQEELRSQYFIAYQSSNTSERDTFRSVEIKLGRQALTAKTISGYYP